MASLQETFDIVVNHLRQQGCRSLLKEPTSGGTDCAYRGEDGLKCAAGVLIPDHEYSSNMEGLSADAGIVKAALQKEGHEFALVYFLQIVHDSYDVTNWEKGFREVAANCGLEYKEPEVA